MLRKFVFSALVVLCFMQGQAQCTQDTLVPFTIVVFAMDSAPIPCYPYQCTVEQCHYWQLPDSFKGGVFAYNHGDPFEVIILDSCHLSIYDTCMTIDSVPDGFQMHYNFPAHSQLVICGAALNPIGVDIKPDPSGLLNNFGAPLVDLDTLCLNSITPAIQWQPTYIEWPSLREVKTFEPNKQYKRREQYNGQ